MKTILLTSLLFWLATAACAQTLADTGEWQLSLSAGYGETDNPIKGRDDLQMYVLPELSYYGERFYMENTHLGYALYEQEDFYVDLVGQFNEDGYFYVFDGSHALGLREIIMPDFGYSEPVADPGPPVEKDLSYLAGISATWKIDDFALRLSSLIDVTAGHHGSEFHFSISRDLQFDKFRLRALAKVLRKSSATTNYYYNFSDGEIGENGQWYHLDASWQLQFRLVAAYSLTPKLDIIAQWQYNKLDDELAISPLLTANHYNSRFIGLRFRY